MLPTPSYSGVPPGQGQLRQRLQDVRIGNDDLTLHAIATIAKADADDRHNRVQHFARCSFTDST
jgi:hypothetical protein